MWSVDSSSISSFLFVATANSNFEHVLNLLEYRNVNRSIKQRTLLNYKSYVETRSFQLIGHFSHTS